MKITFNKIEQIAKEVLQQEYEEVTEENIREFMKGTVKNQEKSLILQALGIEKEWNGELRVRYSGSFSDVLKVFGKQKLEKLAEKLYEEISESVEFQLTAKELCHLRKAYRESYMQNAEEIIRNLAVEHSSVETEKVFQEFLDQE